MPASAYATQLLDATGSAKVIAVLRDAKSFKAIQHCFSWNNVPESQRPQPKPPRPARRGGATVAALPKPPEPMRYLPNLGVVYGHVDREGLEKLSATPNVTNVSGAPPIRLIRAQSARPATLTAPVTWGIQKLRVPDLWAKGLTGKGVLIGHLDTGIDGTHPALKTAIQAFALFDASGEIDPDQTTAIDTAKHGTHTAGTIAGRKVGGRSIGVAPGAGLICGAVIEGGDEIGRVLAGIDWAIGKKIRILNLSLGFPGYWPDFVPILEIIREKGVLPVFAIGNEGPNTSRSPGNYPSALSVGAIDDQGRVAPNSSSQRFTRTDEPLTPKIVMPGVGVISANAGGGYRADDGTSMAAPHATGLAALLWEAEPAATVAEIEDAIFASCSLPARADRERANRGLPNAIEALKRLRGARKGAVAAGGRIPT